MLIQLSNSTQLKPLASLTAAMWEKARLNLQGELLARFREFEACCSDLQKTPSLVDDVGDPNTRVTDEDLSYFLASRGLPCPESLNQRFRLNRHRATVMSVRSTAEFLRESIALPEARRTAWWLANSHTG